MAKLSILPDSFIQLRHELGNHPDILEALAPAPDSATWLEMLCTQLGVVVDGYYSESDYDNLCKLLIRKLQDRRVIHVITGRK